MFDWCPAFVYSPRLMNDDVPELDLLKSEHRRLDLDITALEANPQSDQLEIARLKKRKLRLKDQIQLLVDRTIPDIIA